jgi:hypothetical protein
LFREKTEIMQDSSSLVQSHLELTGNTAIDPLFEGAPNNPLTSKPQSPSLMPLQSDVANMGSALLAEGADAPVISAILEQASARLQQNLLDLRQSSDFAATFRTAFGNHWSLEEAEFLVDQFGVQIASPEIKAVETEMLQGEAAYGDNTIFISREYVVQNAANPAAIDAVLLEEAGHYFDEQLNEADSLGDEGDIFARLAQGETLSESTLAVLQSENDHGVLVDGKTIIPVEYFIDLGSTWDSFSSSVSSTWDSFSSSASDTWNSFSDSTSDTWSSISDTTSSLWEDTSSSLSDSWDSFSDSASDTWSSISDTTSDTWDSFSDSASDTWSSISDTTSDTWDSFSDSASDTWSSISDSTSDPWSSISDSTSSLWEDTSDSLSSSWDSLTSSTSDYWDSYSDSISNTLDNTWDSFSDNTSSLWEDTSDSLYNSWDSLTGSTSDYWDSFSNSASDTWNLISDSTSGLWEDISPSLSNSWDSLTSSASDSWNSFANSASETWNSISETASDAWDATSEFVTEDVPEWMANNPETVNRVVGGIQVVGGVAEMLGGTALLPTGAASFGAGTVAGGVVIAHGADTTWAGLNALITGESQKTFTEQGATAAADLIPGVDTETAEKIGSATDLVLGLASGPLSGLDNVATSSADEVVDVVVATADNVVAPAVDNAVAPVLDNAVAPVVDNAGASVVDNAVAPAIDNAVAPVVDNAVAPVVDNAVAPVVDNAVAPVVDNAVTPVVDNVVTSVAPVVDNAVAPIVDNIVDNAVTPVVDNAVAPVVDNVVTPVVDNVVTSVAPVVDNAVAPVVDNAVAPVVDNAVAPVMDNAVTPVVDNVVTSVAPVVDNAVAPVVDNAVAPVMDNAVAPVVDNVVTSTADDVGEGAIDDLAEGTADDVLEGTADDVAEGTVDDVVQDVADDADDAVKTVDDGPQCFVAGTPILTRYGKKPIEDLRPGDWVVAWDEETGEIIERSVTDWYQREVASTIDVFVGIEKISCSTEHPFWVDGKGWVLAFQLKRGMHLRTRDGELLAIDEIRCRDEVTQVYNVEIDGFHTYFVSGLEILSHNMCGGNPALIGDDYYPGEVWRRQVDFENTYLDWNNVSAQNLGRNPSSNVLSDNLEAIGSTRPPNSAVHHMVAGSDRRAASVRAILRREGIDINEAANGIFLPRRSAVAQPPVLPHSRIHTDRYYNELTLRLRSAQPGAVRETLREIAAEIANGTFPF